MKSEYIMCCECGEDVSSEDRDANGGCCPHCHAEIEMVNRLHRFSSRPMEDLLQSLAMRDLVSRRNRGFNMNHVVRSRY